jgi:hypothetical protein
MKGQNMFTPLSSAQRKKAADWFGSKHLSRDQGSPRDVKSLAAH